MDKCTSLNLIEIWAGISSKMVSLSIANTDETSEIKIQLFKNESIFNSWIVHFNLVGMHFVIQYLLDAKRFHKS